MMDPNHLLHQSMVGPTTVHEEILRSRRSFVPAVRRVFSKLSELRIRAAQWAEIGTCSTSVCNCGATDQIAVHVILKCPLYCAY